MIEYAQDISIILPSAKWQEIVNHCTRKLAGDFLPGETEVNRANGILAGVTNESTLTVERVLLVKKNARNVEPLKTYMDMMMTEHAKPSTTPLGQRGWITDPEELRECCEQCEREDINIFGTYHIHMVPWEGDPLRDTPTHLDKVLAENSNLYTFIVAMVDMSNPSIRAFYEGDIDKETPVIINND